ncbi:MAG TPA: hypothetical protein VJU59_12190 [Paraburkholderia sp.]|uniref:hypothetical protein n=1 Tax=Paraburkholderia sp. TaxID=1926495 RepID=UPI002B480D02|nr:hypothetical protein [Paraburkholderia sp.]HKR40418.1 hypothetical protein [Paraburkholderia sp.]
MQRIAAEGGKAKSHKTAFCREHGISARMFNAIAIELQGLIDGTRELLKEERRDLTNGIHGWKVNSQRVGRSSTRLQRISCV